MYFDQDGDLAHEFYEEVPSKKRGIKTKMKKIVNGLTPEVNILIRNKIGIKGKRIYPSKHFIKAPKNLTHHFLCLYMN